ncbi:MAG: CPBP family intramembrane metalloprotease [Bacteriovoracaceae bacterium]|nr:CPBP family intramembrane metalloprotease [Bacteriovoracaceae bacterium]
MNEIKTIIKDLKDPSFLLYFLIIFILLTLEYFGWQGPFYQHIAPSFALRHSAYDLKLWAQSFTTVSFIILFILIPVVIFRIRKDLNLQGLSLPRKEDLPPYFIFAGAMLLVLAVICSQESFYNFYPLYRPKNWLDWGLFELIYLPQFIAVEFFFRGPILFALNERMGRISIIMMTLPYAMIHIHKPFPEAIGSVFAGLVLSHYSLKSKSIWPGVCLHICIAFSADFLGLFYSGTLSRW